MELPGKLMSLLPLTGRAQGEPHSLLPFLPSCGVTLSYSPVSPTCIPRWVTNPAFEVSLASRPLYKPQPVDTSSFWSPINKNRCCCPTVEITNREGDLLQTGRERWDWWKRAITESSRGPPTARSLPGGVLGTSVRDSVWGLGDLFQVIWLYDLKTQLKRPKGTGKCFKRGTVGQWIFMDTGMQTVCLLWWIFSVEIPKANEIRSSFSVYLLEKLALRLSQAQLASCHLHL